MKSLMRLALASASLALFAAMAVIAPAPASAAQKFGGNVSFEWSIDGAPGEGLSDITFRETFNPTTERVKGTYVAYQFGFTGQSSLGYTGLQPRPDKDGKGRMLAIFSSFIRGTTADDPGRCTDGADGGAGVSCAVEIDVIYGRTYELYITTPEIDTWTGTVIDTVTGAKTRVGTYTLPAGSGLLRPSQVGFIEYYSVTAECEALQKIDVLLGVPSSGTGLTGAVRAPREYGNCVGAADYSAETAPNGLRIARGSLSSTLSAVTSISATGTTLNVGLDSAAVANANRIVIDVDGRYLMESYAGAVYYGRKSTSGTTTTLTAPVATLKPGSIVNVYLAPGGTGYPRTGQTLLATWTAP